MSKSKSSTITVIVLAWNDHVETADCLRSLSAQTPAPHQILLVDNGSDADVAAELARLAGERGGEYVRSETNLGYGRGMNLGLRAATGDVVVLSNNDLIYRPGALAALLAALEDPRAGLVLPRVARPGGGEANIAYYFLTPRRLAGLALGLNGRWPERFDLQPPAGAPGDWYGGACLALRRADLVRWGGVSEASHMYAEDLRLCARVRDEGLDVRPVAAAEVVHFDDAAADRRWAAAEKVARQTRELLRATYERRPAQAWLVWPLFTLAVGLRALLLRAPDSRAMARQALRTPPRSQRPA